MNNLFSTFDPQSWISFPLNWLSAFFVILVFPSIFWVSNNQAILMFKTIIWRVLKEFKAILLPHSNPAFALLPLSLFTVIILNNSIGLTPYVFTASRHIVFTLALALPLWLGHMSYAALKTPTSILAHLVPLGTPVALIPFMVLIEIIRRVIRPLTLSVRLAANIIAGHLLLSLIAGQAHSLPVIVLIALIAGLIMLATLECAVRIIQAYVFRVLSSLYLNEVNRAKLEK